MESNIYNSNENKTSKITKIALVQLIVFGIVLFIIGFAVIGHSLGFISAYMYHIVISWQMLIIGFGVLQVVLFILRASSFLYTLLSTIFLKLFKKENNKPELVVF